MEPPSIAAYLDELRRKAHLSGDDLAELEDHLLTSIQADVQNGLPQEAAEQRAINNLGPIAPLAQEFQKESTMNPLSRLLGISFSFAALAAAIMPYTSVGSYVDVPSFLLVLGLVVGGLMASFGPRATLRALRQALESAPLPGRDVTDSMRLARHGYHLSWAAGGVGVLIGVVNILANLGDPSQLGGGLALALLSLLYGALFAELVFANATQWLQRGARPEAAEGRVS